MANLRKEDYEEIVIGNNWSDDAGDGGVWKRDWQEAGGRRTSSEAGTEEAGVPVARGAGDAEYSGTETGVRGAALLGSL